MTPHRKFLVEKFMGFLQSEADERELLEENRLQQVLVRTSRARFLCPIQDLAYLRELINGDPENYIRDVSVSARW